MATRQGQSTRRQTSVAPRFNGGGAAPPVDDGVNVVVVVGEVARDASSVETADGTVYTGFDVVCRGPHGRTVVPVTVEGEFPVRAGEKVAVLGRVNKRFYAAGPGLASRTDVRAEKAVIIRRKDQVSRVISAAVSLLGAA